jgi:hypothetical protein
MFRADRGRARLARPEVRLANQLFDRVGVCRQLPGVAGQSRGVLDHPADARPVQRLGLGAARQRTDQTGIQPRSILVPIHAGFEVGRNPE